MKVHQIISESQVDEAGPLNWAMKKMGSKAAANKSSIDADVNDMASEFKGQWKNTNAKQPTFGLLYNFLKQKGLPVGTEAQFISNVEKLGPSLGTKTKGVLKKGASGAWQKAKDAGGWLGKKATQGYQAVKKGFEKEPTKMEPAGYPKTSFESVTEAKIYETYYKFMYEAAAEDAIDPLSVNKIISWYTKDAFGKGAQVAKKSKYAVGSDVKAAGDPNYKDTPKEPATGSEAGTPIPKGTKSMIPDGVDEFTADGNGGWIAPDGTPLKPDHPYNKKLDASVRSKSATGSETDPSKGIVDPTATDTNPELKRAAKKGTNPAGAKLKPKVKKAIATVKGAGFKVTSNDGAEL